MKINNKGMSLVELLVAIAVVAVLISVMVGVLLDGMKSSNKSKAISMVEEQGSMVLTEIRKNLLSADSDSLVCAADGSSISFESRKGGGVTEIICDSANQRIASVSALPAQNISLTNDDVIIESNCQNFVVCDTSGSVPTIDISFILSTANQTEIQNRSSREFRSKVVIRN